MKLLGQDLVYETWIQKRYSDNCILVRECYMCANTLYLYLEPIFTTYQPTWNSAVLLQYKGIGTYKLPLRPRVYLFATKTILTLTIHDIYGVSQAYFSKIIHEY